MAAPDRGAIPQFAMPVTAEALQRLPLDPTDGFVLSRIDGRRTYDELVRSTGLSSEVVAASLVKLATLGVVSGIEVPEAPATSSPLRSGAVSDVAEDGVDLEPDHKARILDTFARLDDLDHYAILDLARDADKKAIKRAYFDMAGVFHPDRFFRKELGDYKPKMVAIFARATEAHDVLTNKAKRADYDLYLRDLSLTRQFEGPEGPTAPSKGIASRPPEPSGPAPRIELAPDPGPASGPRSLPFQGMSVPSISIPSEPADPRARRDALARKLLGGRASLQPPPSGTFGRSSFGPPSSGSSGPVSGSFPSSGRDPASDGANGPNSTGPKSEVLRHHYEQRMADVKRTQALRHVEEARLAKANGDRVHAIERLRLALTFTPDDTDLRRRVAEETAEMETELIDTYRRQATYEEEHGRFVDAARSWTHLARLQHDDPDINDHAARAHLKAGGALHQARFFAQRAVTLSPMQAAYRATLGLVYLEAGLAKNARRELEAAEQLAPQDASIAALLKRLGPEVPK